MQFSIKASKVTGTKRKVHEDTDAVDVQPITSFSADDAPRGEEQSNTRKARVIACGSNKLLVRGKETPETLGKLEDKFGDATQHKESDGTYGLVTTRATNGDARAQGGNTQNTEVATRTTFAAAVAGLPDAPDVTSYDSMPVEEFGMALLRGMGCTEDNQVPTVDYVARPSGLGLGAKPGDANTGKRSYKHLVDADGRTKSTVKEGEKVIDVATLGPRVGKRMQVAAGRHAGLACVVRELNVGPDQELVRVRLHPSEQDVLLAPAQLTEPGAPLPGGPGRSGPSHGSSKGAAGKGRSERADRTHAKHTSSRKSHSASWLRDGIRVRVVDKHLKNGRLYLRKAEVVDVVGPHMCVIRMTDDRSVHEDIQEDQLETVVSRKEGTVVAILRGRHNGRHARLVEKSQDSAVVQTTQDRDVLTLSLDDVADYVGFVEGEDF